MAAAPIGIAGGASRRTRWGAALRGDRRGTAAMEFAIVALPFFGIMVAILQITTTFLAQQTLETVSEKAVRQLVTGTAQKAAMTQDQFKTLICNKLPSFMKCANILVDVRTSTAFSSADTSQVTITFDNNGVPNNSFQFAPGNSGEITVVKVMYIWNVQAGPLGLDLSNMAGSRKLLTATSVFKTEPY